MIVLNFNFDKYPIVLCSLYDGNTGEMVNFDFKEYKKYLKNGIYIVRDLKICYNYLVDFLSNEKFKILKRENIKNNCFKALISSNDRYFINFKFDNQNILIENFDTKFPRFDLEYLMREKNFNEAQAISYVCEKATIMGLNGGHTLASSIRKLYMNKFHGAKEIRGYRFNTKRFDDEQNMIVDQSLKGGRAFLNPKYKRVLLKKTEMLDINSSYPYIAMSKPLPHGVPMSFNNEDDYLKYKVTYPISIYRIVVSAKIKDNCISFIGNKVGNDVSYPNEFDFNVISIWNFELEEMKKFYHISHLRILKIVAFKTSLGFFDDILNYFAEIKENAKEYTTLQLAKMGLNNFLGKFGSKRQQETEMLTDDGFDIECSVSDNYYQPLFSAVTAYGRLNICSKINRWIGLDKLIYCDTDSLVFFRDKLINELFNINSHEFGAWKLIYLHQFIANGVKVYSYMTEDNKVKSVIAGVKDCSDLNPKSLYEGYKAVIHQLDYSGVIPQIKVVKKKF